MAGQVGAMLERRMMQNFALVREHKSFTPDPVKYREAAEGTQE